jgi:hypothetical protein
VKSGNKTIEIRQKIDNSLKTTISTNIGKFLVIKTDLTGDQGKFLIKSNISREITNLFGSLGCAVPVGVEQEGIAENE